MTPSYSNKKRAVIIKIINLSLIPLIILCDRVTKYSVEVFMTPGQTKPLIKDFLHITYVRNTGAAFSIFRDNKIMTIALPIVLMFILICAIVVLFRREQLFPMGCICVVAAGGIGNLIDRMTLGYVVDMIDFRFFPVFNVADIAVTCGCISLLIWAFVSERFKERNSLS